LLTESISNAGWRKAVATLTLVSLTWERYDEDWEDCYYLMEVFREMCYDPDACLDPERWRRYEKTNIVVTGKPAQQKGVNPLVRLCLRRKWSIGASCKVSGLLEAGVAMYGVERGVELV